MALKEELTTAMHSEFYVSKEIDIRHKAGCVWTLLDGNASEQEVRDMASDYGITYEQAMKYKPYWDAVKLKSYKQNNPK